MPLVNKLGRYCIRCFNRYIPNGKVQRICIDCNLNCGLSKRNGLKVVKTNKMIISYNKLKEEYSKVLHDETLKKFHILNEALNLGYKIYGKNGFSQLKLSKDWDIPFTTVHRILSLRRANANTWKLIKSGKLSSFKATQILLTKSNHLQDQIVKTIIVNKLSTMDIKKFKKADSLEEVKKVRLDRAVDIGFKRKDTTKNSFIHYIIQLEKMMQIKRESLSEDSILEIKEKLKLLQIKIDNFVTNF